MIYITLTTICFSILVTGILGYLFACRWLKYQEDKLINSKYEELLLKCMSDVKMLKERPDYKEELDKMKTQISGLALAAGMRPR